MYERTTGRPERDPIDALVDVLAAADRYDFAIGIVPLAFAVALAVAFATPLSVELALVPAALVGVLVIVDACYLRPPVDPGRRSGTER